jgi:hypothetical protein
MEEELDNGLIDDFEKTDKLYADFYRENVHYVNLHLIYIDKNNDIQKIEQESFIMTKPNFISRAEIIEILKRKSFDKSNKYSLLTILKYNITLDASDIKDYINCDSNDHVFLTPIKNIDSIVFDKTIGMFQDLNDLLFIFYDGSVAKQNVTKRVYLNRTHSKTRRKQYRDLGSI